jgi:drug/metabolite transporter (DMT)-like permease
VPATGIALLCALTILWGSNWPAMKLALREIDPWTFRSLCLVVGGAAVLGLARLGRQPLRVPPAERGPLLWAAFFNITAWHLLSAYALRLIPAGRASIVAYTMPLWTVLLARLVLGEPLTGPRWLGLGLGLMGLVALLGGDLGLLGQAPAGTACMLGGALAWAIGTVLLKRRPWTLSTMGMTGWQLVLGAVPLLAGALVLGSWAPLAHLSPPAAVGVVYAVLVGIVFCHYAWFKVVELLPSGVAAIGTLGIPVVGAVSSALVLGEPLGAREAIALVLVVAGLAVVFRERPRAERQFPDALRHRSGSR